LGRAVVGDAVDGETVDGLVSLLPKILKLGIRLLFVVDTGDEATA
jgi:hypothetical protein